MTKIDMELEEIKSKVRLNEYMYSHHANAEREAESLTFSQIEDAILNGQILEQYSDTGRGESCLLIGFWDEAPIHIVCGWHRDNVVIITVYVPKPPKFLDPWTRGENPDEAN